MPTRTILHPQLEGDTITDFHAIPISICSRTQAKKFISRQPICLSDADYDYILEDIDQKQIDEVSVHTTIIIGICSITQAKKAISRQPICLSDADYDYILEEIEQRDGIIG